MNASDIYETDPIKLHPFLINLLCKFDGLCREMGINYSLAGGTLLAAVRRGAILAWDDDIDVYLLREDFDRFREKYSRYKFEDDYLVLQSYDTVPWMRLCDKRVKMRNKNNHMIRYLLIDIVPLDAVSDDEVKNEKSLKKIKTLEHLRSGIGLNFLAGRTIKVRFLSMFMPIMRKLNALKLLNRIIDKVASQDEDKETMYVSDRVVFGKFCGFIRKDTFNQSVFLSLNGKKFMCIPDYDDYLHSFYGDYFEIPKVGHNHNFSYVLPFEMPYEEEYPSKLGYAEYITDHLVEKGICDFFLYKDAQNSGWRSTIGKNTPQYHICMTPGESVLSAYTFVNDNQIPAAVVSVSARDIAEMIPVIMDAYRESLPIIFISVAEQSITDDDTDIIKRKECNIKVSYMLSQIVKAAVTVNRSELLKYELQELSNVAINGKPGPVLIELSCQLQNEMSGS